MEVESSGTTESANEWEKGMPASLDCVTGVEKYRKAV